MPKTIQTSWVLKRQDDNGQEFDIGRFATREDAERERDIYEARGHKQMYWIENAAE